MKYVVYLTNPDDQSNALIFSFSSGRYGYTVRAETMSEAIAAVIERAKVEGYYGHDWSARIVPLRDNGQVDRDICADRVVRLREDEDEGAGGAMRIMSPDVPRDFLPA